MKKNVLSLSEYRLYRSQGQSMRGRTVVGSDISPDEAIDMVIEHADLSVVSDSSREDIADIMRNDFSKFHADPTNHFVCREDKKYRYFHQKFSKVAEKSLFFDGVVNFLKPGQFRRVRDDLVLVIDELYTNFAKTALTDDEVLDLFVACDSERVVVVCRDPFGTLQPYKMLSNIQRCFAKGVKCSIRNDEEEGVGAGIGSFLMYTISEGMILANVKGLSAIVGVWMPLLSHHEDRITLKKDITVIDVEDGEL